MRKIFLLLSIFSLIFVSSAHSKSLNPNSRNFPVYAPLNQNVFLVVKGVFDSLEEAKKTQKFIQQLLVRTPADGIIDSDNLKGLPKGKWVIASVFDNEKKAKWWLEFSDRNLKLPRPVVKKTQILNNAEALPYFPEAEYLGSKRFASEAEVLKQIENFGDVQSLKREARLKYQFTKYPRSEDPRYEVQIMKEKNGKYISYDFVKLDASNPSTYSRFLDEMR